MSVFSGAAFFRDFYGTTILEELPYVWPLITTL